MKKKSQKLASFVSRTKHVNFLDTSVIINDFNQSINSYKRFEIALKGGDDELAAKKMREAGTTLFRVCEWALKNYLHKRYVEMEKEGIISPNVRICRQDSLQTSTTTIASLMEEFKDCSVPQYQTMGIVPKYVMAAADEVNNLPKHNASVSDPSKYKKALGEIRKILKNYVCPEAELGLVEDTIFGEEKAWYELVEETSDFSEAYSYILVAPRVASVDYAGLFSFNWDMVIDFDPSTDLDGLQYRYREITGKNPWTRMLNQVDSRKNMPKSNIPYWVFANGSIDDAGSISDLHKWRNKNGKHLTPLLEKFHNEDTRPAIVVMYPVSNEKAVERVVESFNDTYDAGDDCEIIAFSAETEFADIDADNFKISALSFEDFCANLGRRFEDEKFVSGLIKYDVPMLPSGTCTIDEAFRAELQDSFEIAFLDIATTEENDAVKSNRINFYQGENSISWYGIKESFDVNRKDKDRIIKSINEDLDDRGRLLRHVYYEPGVGGTTLMRRICWEMREKCPCLILTKKNEQTSKNLQKLYAMTHSPLLIFADNNSIEIEDVKSLQVELKKMGFAFVICYFERKLRGKSINETAAITIVESFTVSEAREMQSRLSGYITDIHTKQKIQQIVDDKTSVERSPFIMAMYTFDKDFKGIKPFIANFLEKMNEACKKILFAVSLADYGNVSLDIQYFVNLFEDESVDQFLVGQTLGISDLIRVEPRNGKKYLRIKYPLFAEEILKQMSGGREAQEISFMNLVQKILVFIEDSRPNRYEKNQDILNALRSLFITRIADADSEKPTFSPLITKLQEEHRTTLAGEYDATYDAITSIFKKLVEVYPEESHFTAHLARFYFYIDKNFDMGFKNIDKAIELSETVDESIDPLLYHMKAMGYSSLITNSLISNILKACWDDDEEEKKRLLMDVEENADQAFKYFKIVRESNIGIFGHISEINLCIHIANMAKRMLEESEDFNSYLMSANGQWAMKYVSRANDLWDECKELVTENDDVKDLEHRLAILTADLEKSIEMWETYIKNSDGRLRLNARRLLARAYEREISKGTEREQENLVRIIQLMEDNMSEESQQSSNIRIWFGAIMRLKSVDTNTIIIDALIKLNKWIALTDSIDAYYYRFVLKFIQSINGSTAAEQELPRLLRELKSKSMSLYNRTSVRHWLTNSGEGLGALLTNSRGRRDAVPEEEMAKIMKPLVGKISNNYVNDSHAYIDYHNVEIYFNPSATKGEIDSTKIHQRVRFGIGFSYDGPRAYNSSVKLLGVEEYSRLVRPLSTGMLVDCEVIKNVQYFTQVRIAPYDNEEGSIHISELSGRYSADNRPKIGEVFKAKILSEGYDEKRGKKVWRLTMSTFTASESDDNSDTSLGAALKKLNLKIES